MRLVYYRSILTYPAGLEDVNASVAWLSSCSEEVVAAVTGENFLRVWAGAANGKLPVLGSVCLVSRAESLPWTARYISRWLDIRP